MKDITRREALKKMYQAVIAVGASTFLSFDDLLAAQETPVKPYVLWFHGTSCSGCSSAFLDMEDVPVMELLTQFFKMVFHPDLSAATGHQVLQVIDTLLESEQEYIFVLEGAIPVKLPHACMIGDKPLTDWVDKLATRATVNVAGGTCAVHGGVTKMQGTLTGAMTLQEYMNYRNIPPSLVNLPSCPMKPEHITYTLLHYIKKGTLPKMDNHRMPKHFFRRSVHERCIYHADYQENFFAEFIGDDGCLFKLGCQGPATKNNCFTVGYNSNTNNCIRAGHPCIGCAGERFPRQIMYHRYADPRTIKNKI
ncbi:MAG: hydrogenase small subunit [SAR324 cluster bacterium]|nr:hydrogenase small subunit [SAR324 cluster bacterium]